MVSLSQGAVMLDDFRWNFLMRMIVAMTVVGLFSACGTPQMPRPPEHYGEFALTPAVERTDPSHRAAVTSVEQRRLRVSASPKPLSSLAVTLELAVPESGDARRLAAEGFRMETDVPEGGRLLAADERRTRAPDGLEVRRDGRWEETETVVVEPGTTRSVRLSFENLTPYAVVGERWSQRERVAGWSGYYRPVGLRIAYPSPGGETEHLTVADPDEASPTWTRDHVDTRLHMLVAPSVLSIRDHETGFLFGTSFGAMHDFTAPWYLRWAADFQAGNLATDAGELVGRDSDAGGASYLRLTAPVTAGGVLRSSSFDMRLGAGWSTGIVKRKGVDELAVPHFVVGEYELVVRPSQQYPFRTRDFAGPVGLYARMSYQLGNLAEREEPPGYLFTFGVALHPEL